ncbi:hypothetical protein [Hymenobacter fastidiosus]|uniref:hypothetical protein n=1 Tax=Hymenobacter fastidiosus TaxID=486264 RepID=UPI0031EF27AE
MIVQTSKLIAENSTLLACDQPFSSSKKPKNADLEGQAALYSGFAFKLHYPGILVSLPPFSAAARTCSFTAPGRLCLTYTPVAPVSRATPLPLRWPAPLCTWGFLLHFFSPFSSLATKTPLVLLFTLGLLSAAACKKETEVDALPKATQEGKHTFGCLVDGKAFVPKPNQGISSSTREPLEARLTAL